MSDLTGEAAVVPPPPPPQAVPSPPVRPGKAQPKVYAPVTIPTPEALAQEEVVNSCVTRSVMAGVMGALTHQNWISLRASSLTQPPAGGLLGSVFGVFMGATDTQARAVQLLAAVPLPPHRARPGAHLVAQPQAAAAAGTAAVAGTPATLTWRDTARASARSAARKSLCVALLRAGGDQRNLTAPGPPTQVLRQGLQHNGCAVLRLGVCDREGTNTRSPVHCKFYHLRAVRSSGEGQT
jgi:hypothetical protein